MTKPWLSYWGISTGHRPPEQIIMSALSARDRQPRLHIDRDRIPVQGGKRARTEIITIMNDGGGVLKGSAIADVSWIRIPNPRIETAFVVPFRIEINPDRFSADNPQKGKVTINTNGGSAQILLEYSVSLQPRPGISLDERQFFFCNLRKGEDFSFDLMVRNSGSGALSGTIESENDWIEVRNRTIWTRTNQVVPVIIHTAAAPMVRQPTGRIRIRSSGGDLEVPVSINFRGGAGPVLRFTPTRIRCVWEKRGIIEETLTIHNDGVGILRGTIPSPAPWLKIIPSIFPVETSTKILFRIDTRMLTADGTLSIQIPIITNAGTHSLTLEVTPGQKTTQVRRNRVSARHLTRTRLTVYDPDGRICSLLSTGKAGGEGEIFHIAGDETRCAKIFHPHRRTLEIEEKIRTMISSPPDPDLLRYLTWPLIPVTDLPRGGRTIGYLMRRIPEKEYRSIHLWYDEPPGRDEHKQRMRIIASWRLAKIVEGVHKAGHVIGDLRENNLLINDQGDLILIDTDSFQIREKGGTNVFWSRVATGEYLPPEHLDGSFAEDGCDRRYGDLFALGVLIFRILMNGAHPFQAKGPLVRDAPATTDKIILGHFAFETRLNGISPPDYAPPYSLVPPAVRALFREVFISGHRCPSARPDGSRWEKVLSTLIPREQKTGQESPVITRQDPGTIQNFLTITGFTDNSGYQVHPGRRLYRLEDGIIAECGTDSQVFLLNSGVKIACDEEKVSLSGTVPASLVIPKSTLFDKGSKPAGWVIPKIEAERYLPWHMLADRESRVRSNRSGFSFNRRIASCRNLMAALISANRLGIRSIRLTERSVFAGPDASIRILCLPPLQMNGAGDLKTGSSPVVLMFRMLMNGYHPFHAIGSKASGYGSHERRMTSGLYPWGHEDPELRPPPGAPPISILPQRLIDLFEQEFGDQDGFFPGVPGYETWFEALNQVYQELICCTIDPDHWYLPGLSGCPWCCQERDEQITGIHIGIPHKTPSYIGILLIAPPRVAGLLTGRTRQRRRKIPMHLEASRWCTIPLPPERIICLLLPRFTEILSLPPEPGERHLPVVWRRQSVPCILSDKNPVDTTAKAGGGAPQPALMDGGREQEKIIESTWSGMDDVTLIDEMIWVSAMDRLRGEGIGQPKKKRGTGNRQPSLRRRPVQVMLLPLDLPIEGEEKHPGDTDRDHPVAKRAARRKSAGKGIRGRLQTILRDFIGNDSNQDN